MFRLYFIKISMKRPAGVDVQGWQVKKDSSLSFFTGNY